MLKRRTSQLLALVVCIAAVFAVPYLFPPGHEVSVSAMAGFNNRAAILVLLGGSLLYALAMPAFSLQLARENTSTAKRVRWAVPIAAVVTVALASLYVWHWASNVGPFDEGIYFLDRFSNQSAGDRVFRDFSFDYGPLLYYPSWWLAAMLRLPVGHGYYLFLLLQWVAGVLLLWWVIAGLRGRTGDRVATFAVTTLAWCTSLTDQGAQYTPLRFVLTSACALWVHRLWQSRARSGSRLSCLAAMAAAALCFTGLLLYSPEQGLGFALATVLFFAIGVRSRVVALPLLGFFGFCAAVFGLAVHLQLVQSLFTFAGGAFNLPVLLSVQTVFLVGMLFAAACVLVQSFRTGQSTRPEVYLIALALVSLPAAFGRADPGHIFINTMPALLVVTLALLQRQHLRAVVLAGWLAYLATSYLTHTRHQVNVVMHSWPRLEKLPPPSELPPAGVTLRAPMRYFPYLDGQFGPKVKTGRFYGYDLTFPGLAELKIAELEAHPHDLIVVPVDYQSVCSPALPEKERQALKDGLMSFYTPRLKPMPNTKQPLCDYIRANYESSPYRVPREEYRVMQPKRFPLASATQMLPSGVAPAAAGLNEATRLP